MSSVAYGFERNLPGRNFLETREEVVAALKEVGFGILTEIDVKQAMKEKLGVDFRNYRILGACNPPLAYEALTAEPMIGLLLPCNVVVIEEDDGSVTVGVIKPTEMFKVVDNPAMAGLAATVEDKVQSVLETL